MTRTDGLVSSGPQTADCVSIGGELRHFPGPADRKSAGGRVARRGLLALPVAMAVIASAGPALAAGSETSGYGQTAPPPKTTTEPKKETAPSKEATTPTTSTAPASTTPAAAAPTTTAASPKQSTLPFTGLDLRWVVAVGVLMLGAGLSIRGVQGRRRHGPGS
jgi:hypothetical protein